MAKDPSVLTAAAGDDRRASLPPLALPDREPLDTRLGRRGSDPWADGDTRAPGADESPERRSSALRVVVLTALAYALLGWLSLFVAIAPTHASPLFPSAGVALAAALVYRWPAMVGIVLGSLTVAALFGPGRGLSGGPAIAVALALALGAGAQAMVGRWAIERWVAQPLTLVAPRDIARFFALAGASCVVGAAFATWVLAQAGVVMGEAVALTFVQWWAGDALGVMIGAPIALTLIGRPRGEWAQRRRSVGLAMGLATLVMAAAIVQTESWSDARERDSFDRFARSAVTAIQHELDDVNRLAGVAVTVGSAIATPWPGLADGNGRYAVALYGPGPDAGLVRDGVLTLLGVLAGDAAYAAPTVPGSAWPGTSSTAGSAPMPGSGTPLPVPARPSLHTLATVPAQDDRAAAVPQALMVGARLADASASAVAEAEGVSNRATHVVAFINVEALIAAALEELPPGYLLCLYPSDSPPGVMSAGGATCSRPAAAGKLLRAAQLSVADARWRVEVRAPANSVKYFPDANVWVLSLVGLLATAMFGALMLTVTGRTRRVQVAVKARTAQLEAQIRERERTEGALRDSEQRFRNILNTVPIGVVYSDLDGHVRQANPKFCELLGYAPDELLERSTHDFTDPEDQAIDAEFHGKLVRGELQGYRLRKRYVARDGRRIWVQSVVTALRDEKGVPRRIVGVAEDITEQLRLAESERARESAEAANRAKSDFLSRMSHELRTPLNAMLGFAQLLDINTREPLSTSQRPWVSQIQLAGWHLLDMINDVLDLSRIEAGTLRLRVEPVLIEPLVRDCVALVDLRASKRNVTVTVEIDADGREAEPRLLGDATRVKQILTNLLTNAIKYNVDGGKVHIRTQTAVRNDGTPGVAFVVSDTGIGLSEEQLRQLFQPFNRLGRERTGAEGTGIGLVISRRLAELMSGGLTVTSEEGRGTTFTLLLPAAAAGRPMPKAVAHPSPGAGEYHRRRVLYIEDNETNVEVMRGVLDQRPQVQLDVAATGLMGLQILRQESVDLLLLDMHLPDMDGLAVLAAMQAEGLLDRTPVVAVSADAMQSQIDAAIDAGASHYLTKPVSVADLLRLVDERLEAVDTQFG